MEKRTALVIVKFQVSGSGRLWQMLDIEAEGVTGRGVVLEESQGPGPTSHPRLNKSDSILDNNGSVVCHVPVEM